MENALPVSIDLADVDLAADVGTHVESVLGWQVVVPGPHLPVRLRLADHPDPGGAPTVVVRRHTDRETVRSALRAGALDVLAWPTDRHRLGDLVPAVVATRPARTVIAVAGAAPGVGTSTVALAIGALHAWDGRPTVVLTDAAGRRLASGPAPRTAGVVDDAVPGISGLHVRSELPGAAHPPIDVLVADRGMGSRARVLVARPDARLVDALADPAAAATAAVVVTVGEGGLRPTELARLLGDRTHVAVPWSFRVGRAGLRGRVPGGLPGRYLHALRPAAHQVAPPPVPETGRAA